MLNKKEKRKQRSGNNDRYKIYIHRQLLFVCVCLRARARALLYKRHTFLFLISIVYDRFVILFSLVPYLCLTMKHKQRKMTKTWNAFGIPSYANMRRYKISRLHRT